MKKITMIVSLLLITVISFGQQQFASVVSIRSETTYKDDAAFKQTVESAITLHRQGNLAEALKLDKKVMKFKNWKERLKTIQFGPGTCVGCLAACYVQWMACVEKNHGMASAICDAQFSNNPNS